MNKKKLFSKVSFFILLVWSLFFQHNIATATENKNDCSNFQITETLLEKNDLKAVDSHFNGLVAGKLFYKEPSGYCVPTNETYLVGLLDGGYPQIFSMLNGHTPSANLHIVDGDNLLFVYYFAGGNQFMLRLYRFVDETQSSQLRTEKIKPLSGAIFASNIQNIELVGDNVLVKNQQSDASGKRTVVTETYHYKAGKFELVR